MNALDASSINLKQLTVISKGWSGDQKYCATSVDGAKYFLRTCSKDKKYKVETMFKVQRQLATLGVSVSKPVMFGECAEGFYFLQAWIDGQDAEEVISKLDVHKQYRYGLEAGRMLKTIHSIPAPKEQIGWALRFNEKMNRKIKMFNDCAIKFDGADNIVDYIESNRYLLKDRPQTFQHGDYHIGNMMIENDRLIIIDFDRYDYGDPWEEFNRIVWSAQASPKFATGMIDGYFSHKIPSEFWGLLALYISSNLLSSIPWAIPFGESEINTMLNLAKDVLNWYNNMQSIIPNWYGN